MLRMRTTLLKDELKKLKKKMKDEQEARREAAIAADEKEGALRESITNLLNAADMPINRARKLSEDSMSDALSLATDSNVQVLGLLQKTMGALSKLFSMIFPKVSQKKTLGEMADTFFIDSSEAIEIPSTFSRADSSLNPSAIDESELVRHLRDQISRLNKDITNLHAMAALVKRKSEIATTIEQHALDRLRAATESLSCLALGSTLRACPGNTWHVGWLPCKYFLALTEELDERAFLCDSEPGRAASGSVAVQGGAGSFFRRGCQGSGQGPALEPQGALQPLVTLHMAPAASLAHVISASDSSLGSVGTMEKE
ncbi:hypothetical protein QYE76_059831 [Lolium multiflorum]|uniref:Uncharacterized protein n=1 Tax=Lolium multiflorum TaxID=4521 RepID=A0AAD8RYQ1_LOLMU|nr:hypothetical protein QYE76_059831 [Lolium multiflorum]